MFCNSLYKNSQFCLALIGLVLRHWCIFYCTWILTQRVTHNIVFMRERIVLCRVYGIVFLQSEFIIFHCTVRGHMRWSCNTFNSSTVHKIVQRCVRFRHPAHSITLHVAPSRYTVWNYIVVCPAAFYYDNQFSPLIIVFQCIPTESYDALWAHTVCVMSYCKATRNQIISCCAKYKRTMTSDMLLVNTVWQHAAYTW